MGLFDSYFDPQTSFDESGGLIGRLLSLQQEQSQYQPGGGFAQLPPAAPASLPLPTPPDNGPSPSIPQTPDLGDRLSAGIESWAHTPVGNPIAALANGFAGFDSGQRTGSGGVVPSTPPSPTPDLGDHLNAGFQNWLHTPVGNPMAAIANGIAGLGSGQRVTDPGAAQTPQAGSETTKPAENSSTCAMAFWWAAFLVI
jgi:hypothetical protein